MNEVTKIENNDIMSKFQKTENILNDVQNIIADWYNKGIKKRRYSSMMTKETEKVRKQMQIVCIDETVSSFV